MRKSRVFILKLVIIFFEISLATTPCDKVNTIVFQEGNLGETSELSWLGVLRVNLHEEDVAQMAVTGVVLIKPTYVIANADDIVRIPQRIFLTETEVMFTSDDDTPWLFTPKSYVTHPEYDTVTSVSIALVELNIDDSHKYPLIPICFPEVVYDVNFIYLTGYTDENDILEKVFYNMRYINKRNCDKFYEKEGLMDRDHMPNSYLCGYQQNASDCTWDNGMALVTNTTGWFTLIGMSVFGPGCAAPARFINMNAYSSWIKYVTRTKEDQDEDYESDDGEFVPVHETFRQPSGRRSEVWPEHAIIPWTHLPYPFKIDHSISLDHFHIEPTNEDSIAIYPFNTTLQQFSKACVSYRSLMYREYFELKAFQGNTGAVTYKLSLYDLLTMVCTCVTLHVECTNRSQAFLSLREHIDFTGEEFSTDSEETPEEIFKSQQSYDRHDHPESETHPPEEKYHLTPEFVKDTVKSGTVLNYDLYIKFEFNTRAVLKFEIYGYPPVFGTTSPIYDNFRRAPLVRPSTTTTVRKFKKTQRNKTIFWGKEVDKRSHAKEFVINEATVEEEVTASVGYSNEASILAIVIVLLIARLLCFTII